MVGPTGRILKLFGAGAEIEEGVKTSVRYVKRPRWCGNGESGTEGGGHGRPHIPLDRWVWRVGLADGY